MVVTQVFAQSKTSPEHRDVELRRFLNNTDFGLPDDLKLFFDLFRDSYTVQARLIVTHLEQDTARKLLRVVPVQIRSLMSLKELLEKLDVTVSVSIDNPSAGISFLVNGPSRSFMIDEPFLNRMYEIVAIRGQNSSGETLAQIQGISLPLERFIMNHPGATKVILRSDLNVTGKIVRDTDPVLFPPACVIYRLIYANPELAAEIVLKLDTAGESRYVTESLAYFPYDQDRSDDRLPRLPISMETLWQWCSGDWLGHG